MLIRFGFEISVECNVPVPMLLALSSHPEFSGRLIGEDYVRTDRGIPVVEYLDGFQNRFSRIVAPPGRLTIWSDCVAEVDGAPDAVFPWAVQHPVEDLPYEVLTFLTASRYCDGDEFGEFAWKTFGHFQAGWPRVQAICDFVHNHATFGYGFGRPTKTAHDVLREKTGVCRDFAHLAVALCRAMNIPARYASGYLGDIGVPPSGPDDFCAWFEVYLSGAWHTLDARHNHPRIGRILMVRGRDAADVAMITSFGSYDLTWFRVWTQQLPDGTTDAEIEGLLTRLPYSDALTLVSSARVY